MRYNTILSKNLFQTVTTDPVPCHAVLYYHAVKGDRELTEILVDVCIWLLKILKGSNSQTFVVRTGWSVTNLILS